MRLEVRDIARKTLSVFLNGIFILPIDCFTYYHLHQSHIISTFVTS